MSEAKRAEINLEMHAGFFRITTPEVVYNITVLGNGPGTTAQIVQQIVEREKDAAVEISPAETQELSPASSDADYYEEVSRGVYNEIGSLAKKLSTTIMALPAEDRRLKRVELDEAGDKLEDAKSQLQDIVEMTEKATMDIIDSVEAIQRQSLEARDLLSNLKDHRAFQEAGIAEIPDAAVDRGEGQAGAEELERLRGTLSRVQEIVAGLAAQASVEPVADVESDQPPPSYYTFSLDVIFQTLYEFCTNEAVKKHIAAAREKAAEIFDPELFIARINGAVAGMAPDGDNFFSVPLGDIFSSLHEACRTDATKKLLKKMDDNKDSIFLDQALPLEIGRASCRERV